MKSQIHPEKYRKRVLRRGDKDGIEAEVLVVRWFQPKGYYVRAYTRRGFVRGMLTDRGGFGGYHIAQCFESAQAASDAAFAAKCWSFDVVRNAGSRSGAIGRGGSVIG